MSLRIKIPNNASAEQQSQPASSSAKRQSSSKRPLVDSENEDDFPDIVDALSKPPRVKRARTVDTDDPSSVVDPGDVEMEVDIDGDVEPEGSAADDNRFLPEDAQHLDFPISDASPPPSSHLKKRKADIAKKRKKSASVSTTTKKKRHVVYSDNDEGDINVEADFTEDDLLDETALSVVDADDDDDFEVDSPPKRGGSKAKADGASRIKSVKGQAGVLKGAKGKVSKEKDKDKEIFMKDERKLPPPLATTSRASSTAAQTQVSDLFTSDEAIAMSATTAAASALDSAVLQPAKDATDPSIAKKRKLPPIKKTKTPGSMGTVTSSYTAPKPPPLLVQESAKPPLPTAEQRKQALTGVRDVDLADSKVYAELFKGTGGNTPRSGLNRRDKEEERRKELDKMRDEARARRAEETKLTFDLQAQADNIARFEQRLRAENSTVLHPNFLAAKFRDEWEMEKRHRRRGERGTPKEEGEA
ncbi:hypothetical protein BS17DRAFT_806221 [Gyrodon lividus]|nr:hypothetical protein BS17DRAFT_806221 [Gyrodon lividus]